MEKDFRKILSKINTKGIHLHQTDFLLTWEKSDEELRTILLVAEALQELRKQNISTKLFESGLAVSNFRDQSTRTRFSFASACNLLGLEVMDLDESKSQIAHGETVRETATMISFLSEIIGIRDDIYMGEGHRYMKEVSEALDDSFANKVLEQRPGLINLQCDMDHPTQSMADLAHLRNYFGGLNNLKGKKIAMTWAYSPSYGKPLSVPQGIIALMTRFGMEVELAHPEGYELIPEIVEIANSNAKKSGGSFSINHSMDSAFKNADIVYPKSWAPYSVMEKRTERLKNKDISGLNKLEEECLEQNAEFINWECTSEKMALTKNGEALYMHCLPADISGVSCEDGEVSSDVFEKYRLETYKEAAYKPYIIAAMILTNKYKNPAEILKYLWKRDRKRIKQPK